MTSLQCREGGPADRDAILELRRTAFAAIDEEKQHADFWQWEFADGYAGAARLFVAESAGRLVGHLACVPQQYEGERSFRAAVAVDAMIHPGFRRQGVFSRIASFAAESLRRDFDVAAAFQIRKDVLPGMLAGGWRPAMTIPVLLKPLTLRGIVRDLLRLGMSPPAATEDAQRPSAVRPLRDGDLAQLDHLVASRSIRQRRSEEFARWRFQRSPRWRYEAAGAFDGDELRAYVVHRDAVLRGMHTLAIADAGVLPRDTTSLRVLLGHLCDRAARRGLALAAALLSRGHPAYRELTAFGFIPGPHRFRLLLQVFDHGLDWMLRAPWSLSWADTDHL